MVIFMALTPAGIVKTPELENTWPLPPINLIPSVIPNPLSVDGLFNTVSHLAGGALSGIFNPPQQ
jgi:hypothetical protein